jgi:hypothetical protein
MSARITRLLLAAAMLLPVSSSLIQANCTQSIMPVFQCGFVGWIAPPPAGSGELSAIWWQLGYGNNKTIVTGIGETPALEGTGIGPPGVFSGNDSGLAAAFSASPCARNNGRPGLTLTEARCVLPQYAAQIPAGALCSNYENSWAGANIDGCADNPRTTNAGDNDNLLNPYFGSTYGPCADPLSCGYPYYTTDYQIDYPMAFLVHESTSRFFALAFVASKTRAVMGGDPSSRGADISENFYDLAEVSNGDLNPSTAGPGAGKHNIIPWQPVPKPRVASVTSQDPNTVTMSLQWDPVRLVHDGSTRPNPRTNSPLVAGGVGVLDHLDEPGGLCRYQLQSSPVDMSHPNDPNFMTWTNLGSPIACGTPPTPVQTTVTIPKTSALRIRTLLGKTPRTTSTTLANCRIGSCGDIGFEATRCLNDACLDGPPILNLPCPLGCASEQAVDTVAERNRNAVTVRFRTTSEITVTGIDILGKLDAVVASVPCKECTSGVGADYEVVLAPGDLKGAHSLRIRLNGPGIVTEGFPVQ